MKIGIIGNGFVGRATRIFVKNYFSNNDSEELFEVLPDTLTTPAKPKSIMTYTSLGDKATATEPHERPPFFKRIFFKPIQVYIYDIRPEACYPPGITLETLDTECDLLFFCLPTPLNHDGSCYTKILEDVIKKCSNPYKIIRSTVPIGFSAKHGCYYMPEFLTEARWENDFRSTKEWIVGIPKSFATMSAANTEHDNSFISHVTDIQRQEFKTRINKLIKRSHKNGSIDSRSIVFCDTNEAEMVKHMKNCFLSAKVSLMNEFHDLCNATRTDYNTVIELAKKDARMGTSHFQVPGPDGRRGFGGTCFPKDTHSLYSQMNAHGLTPYIFPAVLTRNDTHDRPEREWSKDIWRTTIPLPSPTSKVIVVIGDASTLTSTFTSSSAYISEVIRSNLEKNNIVIHVIRENRPNTDDIDDVSSHYVGGLASNVLHNNLFIKHQMNSRVPLFFPRVDECYYSPYRNNMTFDTLNDISCILELWNNHEEMSLYVIKNRPNNIITNNSYNNESDTEGFDDDFHDDDNTNERYTSDFDYAKIFEDCYSTIFSNSKRRLIVMF
jgi:UDPglucose 6-dehydrogenase